MTPLRAARLVDDVGELVAGVAGVVEAVAVGGLDHQVGGARVGFRLPQDRDVVAAHVAGEVDRDVVAARHLDTQLDGRGAEDVPLPVVAELDARLEREGLAERDGGERAQRLLRVPRR